MRKSFSIPQINRTRHFPLPLIAWRSSPQASSTSNLHKNVHRRRELERKIARICTSEAKRLETSRAALARKSSISTSRARLRRRPGKIAAPSSKRQPRHSSCRTLRRLKHKQPSTLQSHRQRQITLEKLQSRQSKQRERQTMLHKMEALLQMLLSPASR